MCENDRPISLLCVVAHKLLAGLLLHRLQQAGAEDRLTQTQCGFRRGRGTTDTIHAVRRHIELAHATLGKMVGLHVSHSAGTKAFDSINAEALLAALRHFRVPLNMLTLIGNIYEARRFCVADGAINSSERKQIIGISQGCPLSPIIFVMLMAVVLRDSENNLSDNDKFDMVSGSLSVLLYADDTLLIGRSQTSVQHLLDNIALAGARV